MNYSSPNLETLVPEYRSKIRIIRNYFLDRIRYSLNLAKIKSGEKILDVGCGEAKIYDFIAQNKISVSYYGCDINKNILSLNYPNAKFFVVDLEKDRLPFDSDFFDIVFALDVLEHIQDLTNPIEEIYRVLKPNGRFILCGPTESIWYKFCRFLLKGTFSSKEGPDAGEHYRNIKEIAKIIEKTMLFKMDKRIHLPKFLPITFAGVHIIRFYKI